MKIKENLSIYEATQYAKDNGFNSVTFRLNINNNYTASGKFLDAYYDFVILPVVGDGFVRLNDFREEYGDKNVSMDIIDDKEYKTGVWFDFVVRGRYNEVPEEYKPIKE